MALNTHMSDTSANAAANAIAPLCNNGFFQLYDGVQPASGNVAVTTQNLAATLRFGATAFAAASGGVITANAITSDPSAAFSTTVTWFRIFESDHVTVVMDGSIGVSGANLNLNSNVIASGTVVACTAYTHTLVE
jgi:hypothetical protein